MPKISVVINTLNEAAHLPACLASVRWADEIIVVDMHSSDGTVAIAESAGCRVFQHERMGYVEPARNFAIAKATHPWVLVLDADERVTPALATWMKKNLDQTNATAFRLPRRNHYGEIWVTCCGWFPDEQLRLFRREKVKYSDRIHRAPDIDGTIENLPVRGPAHLLHYGFYTLEARAEKNNKYSSIAAKSLYQEGRRSSAKTIVGRTLWAFIAAYFFQGGYRFGALGAVLAWERSQATFWKYAKLWEFQQREPESR